MSFLGKPLPDKGIHLEDIIRALAERGELSHISLTPSQDGKLFLCAFTPCSRFGISYAEDEDPAKAIYLACTTMKLKPVREPKRNIGIDGDSIRLEEKPHVEPSASEDVDDLM